MLACLSSLSMRERSGVAYVGGGAHLWCWSGIRAEECLLIGFIAMVVVLASAIWKIATR